MPFGAHGGLLAAGRGWLIWRKRGLSLLNEPVDPPSPPGPPGHQPFFILGGDQSTVVCLIYYFIDGRGRRGPKARAPKAKREQPEPCFFGRRPWPKLPLLQFESRSFLPGQSRPGRGAIFGHRHAGFHLWRPNRQPVRDGPAGIIDWIRGTGCSPVPLDGGPA